MKAALVLPMLAAVVALAVPAQAASVQSPSGPAKVVQPFATGQPNGLAMPPQLSCRVGFDRGWGALQIRNDGAAPLPVGTRIQWLTSSGRSGAVRLRERLDPGWQDYEPSLFPGTMADYNATCTAAVAVSTLQGLNFGQQPFGQQSFVTPVIPHLSCQVRFEGPWAALDLRNDGSAAIPAGTKVQWRTSMGRAGVLQLTSRLAPGWQERVPSLFVRTKADSQSACEAAIVAPGGPSATPRQGILMNPATAYSGQLINPLTLPKSPARFEPPLSPHGQRLHACQSVASDVCGSPVAQLYCQQRGYAHATSYDTNKRWVQAETLAGEMCALGKCRVFDYIACAP
jgi:hypothetical protein